MKKGIRTAVIILVIILITAGMGRVAYKRYKDKIKMISLKKQKENIEISTPVAVVRAKRGVIVNALSLTGRVYAHSEVNIFSTVPGKVKNILVSEGDRVKKDQVLLYIDRSEAGLVYAPTPVKSTIDGIIKTVFVDEGAYIVPQNPLVQVIDIDPVEMVVNIPEKDVQKVKTGMNCVVNLIAYQDRVFQGKIFKISPVLDPRSGTLEARIKINNPDGIIRPGMFGSTNIIIEKHKSSIVIPADSIVIRDGKKAVFIAEKGIAEIRMPVFGIKEADKIEVIKGIREGEKVIVIGQQNLNNGDKVNVTEELE